MSAAELAGSAVDIPYTLKVLYEVHKRHSLADPPPTIGATKKTIYMESDLESNRWVQLGIEMFALGMKMYFFCQKINNCE